MKNRAIRVAVALGLAGLCLGGSVQEVRADVVEPGGEVLAGWDLEGLPGNQAWSPVTTTADRISASSITRGPGINPSGLNNGMSANNWSNNLTAERGTREDALEQGDYFEVSLNADEGHMFSLGALDVNLRRSGMDAPSQIEWQFSFDGFETPGTSILGTPTYTYHGRASGGGRPGTGENAGEAKPTLALEWIDELQNIHDEDELTLRMYAWGTDGDGRTLALGRLDGNDLQLRGDVSVIPEPASLVLMGAGGALMLVRRRRTTT